MYVSVKALLGDFLAVSYRNLRRRMVRSEITAAKDGHARIILMRPETILH
jgi:hypothetical protein